MSTKLKGNKAESIIMSEFIRREIPVLIPFGDNEKYDLVVEIDGKFKSVQVKYGAYKNGCVIADVRHRIGNKRINYETYANKVDYIAIWCEYNNVSYLIPILEADKTYITLRIENPKTFSPLTTIMWGVDFEFSKQLNKNTLRSGAEEARWAHNPEVTGSNPVSATK